MKKSLTCLGVALALVSSAQGALIVDAVETGGDVVFTGEGSLNGVGWDFSGVTQDFAFINPAEILLVGPTPSVNSARFFNPTNFVGPTDFGIDLETVASSGSGDIFGLFFDSELLVVPGGYVHGDPLSGVSTYAGHSFASLGMEVGSYTWSWTSLNGQISDSLTLNVGQQSVPEPSTVAFAALGLIGLASQRRRRRH